MVARRILFVVCVAAMLCGTPLIAAPAAAEDGAAIRALLTTQEKDWNRGDLDAFATGYKNSPDILFIGSKIRRGYAAMLERYHEIYPTKEKMGSLSFSDVEVQPLGPGFATATGRFHLTRTEVGGGDAAGSWMLVFEKTARGWKIVRDVTIPAPKP
jgi:uncharacterized protein (TIGR02246 family)